MREQISYRRKLFIENKNILCDGYRTTNRHVLLYVAYSAALRGERVNVEKLKDCGRLINDRTAWYSTMRGMAKVPISYMLSRRGNREGAIDEIGEAIELLGQQKFRGSDERVLCAKLIVEHVERACRPRIAEKAMRIYRAVQGNHPFLTSCDDYPYVVLMAMSEKDEESLVRDSEAAYEVLKPELGAYNSTQALSLIFSICEDAAGEARRFLALHGEMKAQKCKFYSGSIEIAALGALSVCDGREADVIAAEVKELFEGLKEEKGFGGVFAYVTRAQRLMYACMLVSESGDVGGLSDTVNFSAVIAQIAAETTAMVAAIVAVNAASNAAN